MTTYAFQGIDTDKTYGRLHDATAFADKAAREHGLEVTVIAAETETVVYVTSVAALAKVEYGEHFRPYTRLETPKFQAPAVAGWAPAYTRKRIEATVYRRVDGSRGWLVHDGRTGGFQQVANTKEACQLTTAMRQGHLIPA